MLYNTGMIELIHGDCLEEMKKIPDGSVDLVLLIHRMELRLLVNGHVIRFEPNVGKTKASN